MSRILGRIPSPPPTLADVAERAGVSRQTVSNALNNPDLLRADTLERVQEAISDLDYSPNRAARSLRTRTSHLIGLRIGPAPEGTANALMDRFVHSLVETSREAGYHVLLVAGDAEDPVAGYDDLLRSTAVDAFVVTDTFLGNPQAAWLESRRAPFVAFGRPWDNPEATHPWVDVDGAAGSELAATHLLERGHSRIAWIGWRKDSWIGEDRRAGWSRALRSRGLPTTGLASRVEDTVASGREASAVLLDEAQPSAFVCASDTLAMGVLHTLAERGLTPGRDIAVVGFDDSQVAQVAPPGLTSVRQPLEDVAVEIVKALEGLLGHPPFVGPGVAAHPHARGARDELGRGTGPRRAGESRRLTRMEGTAASFRVAEWRPERASGPTGEGARVSERRRQWPGFLNARSLEGLPTRHGEIGPGRLYRSDEPTADRTATPSGPDGVDLRSEHDHTPPAASEDVPGRARGLLRTAARPDVGSIETTSPQRSGTSSRPLTSGCTGALRRW